MPAFRACFSSALAAASAAISWTRSCDGVDLWIHALDLSSVPGQRFASRHFLGADRGGPSPMATLIKQISASGGCLEQRRGGHTPAGLRVVLDGYIRSLKCGSLPAISRRAYDAGMLRRDFLNNTLLGVGAALLRQFAPAQVRDTFTGYGGVGDYAASNGDSVAGDGSGTQTALRGLWFEWPRIRAKRSIWIIVGGGLSGLSTAYYFGKGATGGTEALPDSGESRHVRRPL